MITKETFCAAMTALLGGKEGWHKSGQDVADVINADPARRALRQVIGEQFLDYKDILSKWYVAYTEFKNPLLTVARQRKMTTFIRSYEEFYNYLTKKLS